MLFGVSSLVGGEVWFEDADGNKSTTVATVCPTTLSGSVGELRMHFRVDGSHYEWVTTMENTREYLPTIRCTYVLSNYVNIDSNGKIINVAGDGITTLDFPSNVAVRPDIHGLDCVIIADGIAIEYKRDSFAKPVPRLVLPRTEAPKNGTMSKSVFCCVPVGNGDASTVATIMRFIPAEVY